jgi:putative DNA primase/helicase
MTPAEIRAADIVKTLGAKPSGSGWVCRCPVPSHDDKHASFGINVRDGKLYVHCLAGCSQGQVIDELKRRGLWGKTNVASASTNATSGAKTDAPKDPMKPWRNAGPFMRNSPVDIYLKTKRGLELTDDEAGALRFSPAQWHWPTKTRWPAMLARVALATGEDITSHQTFIEPDGSGKAEIEKPRLFAAGGKTVGGGVWFGKPDPERQFIVAEGIESTLSAMRIFDVTAGCAALSEGGVRKLVLPTAARLVRIFPDHDELGQSLAAAHDASRRWRAEERTVRATMSPNVGEDANDTWLARLRKRN